MEGHLFDESHMASTFGDAHLPATHPTTRTVLTPTTLMLPFFGTSRNKVRHDLCNDGSQDCCHALAASWFSDPGPRHMSSRGVESPMNTEVPPSMTVRVTFGLCRGPTVDVHRTCGLAVSLKGAEEACASSLSDPTGQGLE